MQKSFSRRELLKYVGLGSAAAVLAACQPKVVEVERVVEKEVERVVEVPVQVGEQVTIKYHARAAAMRFPGSEYPIHQIRLSEFREEHPEINVVPEEIAGDHVTEYPVKVATMFAGGTLGDMLFTSQSWLFHHMFAADGVLAPVGDMMDKYGVEESEWWPAAMEASYYEDKLYGLPMVLHPGGQAYLFYNKDMWDEAGLDVPDSDMTVFEDLDDALWSYSLDDFWPAANALSQGDPTRRSVFGFMPGFKGAQNHQGWMRMMGADGAVNAEGTQSLMNTPEALEWFRIIHAVYQRDRVSPLEEAIPAGGANAMFTGGALATLQSGTWARTGLLEAGFPVEKLGIALFPVGPGGYAGCGYLNSFAPTSATKHMDETWLLTYAFCDERAGYLQQKMVGSLSGRPDTFDFPDIWADPYIRVWRQSLVHSAPQWTLHNFRGLEHIQTLNAAIDAVILGDVEPTQAYMDSVYTDMQRVIDMPR